MFEKEFETAPVAEDFVITESVLAAGATTPVEKSVTGTITVDGAKVTTTLTSVDRQPEDQVLTYSVSFKGSEAVKSNEIVINGSKAIDTIEYVKANGDKNDLRDAEILANSDIEIMFLDQLDSTTVKATNFKIVQNGITQAVASVDLDSTKKKVTIDAPSNGFNTGKEAVLTIANVKKLDGTVIDTQTVNFMVNSKPVILTVSHVTDGSLVEGSTITTLTTGEVVSFTFNDDMSQGTVQNTSNVKLYNVTDSEYVPLTSLAYTSSTKVLAITLPAIDSGKKYQFIFNASVVALNGEMMEDTTFNYFTGTAASLAATNPIANATNVYNKLVPTPGHTAIRWVGTFSTSVEQNTINGSSLSLRESSTTGTMIPATVSYDNASSTVTIIPEQDLKEQETYYVVWTNDIKTTEGRAIAESNAKFTTGDLTKPAVVSTIPLAGESTVELGSDIIISLSEGMDQSTFTYDDGDGLTETVKLKNLTDGDWVTLSTNFTKLWSTDKKTLTLTSLGTDLNWLKDKTYTLTIENDVKDDSTSNSGSGNKLDTDFTLTFTTQADVTGPSVETIEAGTTDLTVTTKGVNVASDIVITFDENVGYGLSSGALVTTLPSNTLDGSTIIRVYDVTNSAYIIDPSVTANIVADTLTLDVSTITGWATATDELTLRIELKDGFVDINDNKLSPVDYTISFGTKPSIMMDTASYPRRFATSVVKTVGTAPGVYVVFDEVGGIDLNTLTSNTVKLMKGESAVALATTNGFTRSTYDKNTALTYSTTATSTVSGSTVLFGLADTSDIVAGDIVAITRAGSGLDGTFYGYVSDATGVANGTNDLAITVLYSTVTLADDGASGTATVIKYPYVKLKTAADLAGQETYTIAVSSALTDKGGNPLSGSTSYTFTTSDDVQPVINAQTPADGAIVQGNANITLTFSESMLESTISDNTNVWLQEFGSSTKIAADYVYDDVTKTLTIDPDSYLKQLQVYELVINRSAVRDSSNVAIGSGDKVYSTFSTTNTTYRGKVISATLSSDAKTLIIKTDVPAYTATDVTTNATFEAIIDLSDITLGAYASDTFTAGGTTISITTSSTHSYISGVSSLAAKAALVDVNGVAFDTNTEVNLVKMD
jgi:hypothetical protein